MKDFSLQGKVYLGASLAGGKPGAMHWVNDAGVLPNFPIGFPGNQTGKPFWQPAD